VLAQPRGSEGKLSHPTKGEGTADVQALSKKEEMVDPGKEASDKKGQTALGGGNRGREYGKKKPVPGGFSDGKQGEEGAEATKKLAWTLGGGYKSPQERGSLCGRS